MSGQQLAERALIQATRFGAEMLTQKATGIRTENNYNIVQLADGREVSCRVCLLAIGVNYRMLDVPGLERLTGAGVYYGANLAEAVSIFKLIGSKVSKASAPRALPQTNVKMQAVKKATSQPRLVAKRAVALAKPSSAQEKADDWEEF